MAKAKEAKPVAVRAIERGFFGGKLRDPGEQFQLADEAQFSEVWMEKVKPGAKAKKPESDDGDGAKTEPTTDSGDDLKALRDEYKAAHPEGKGAFNGWDADELRARIEGLKAGGE